MSTNLSAYQILPRLQVRAHLIDVSHGSLSVGIKTFGATIQDNPTSVLLAQYPWLEQIFRSRKGQESIRDTSISTNSQGNLHGSDLQLFSEHARCCDKPDPATIFQSYYSVGFSADEHAAGDHVVAVDSVDKLMILREVETKVFRVIGTCYLWAAKELDYWNPGAGKGRWPDRPYDLGIQTLWIEIY
jgi:hypothetical protein